MEKYKNEQEQDDSRKKRIIIYIVIIIIIILALLTSCSCTGKFIGKIGDLFKNEGDYIIDNDTNDLEVVKNKDLVFDIDNLTISVSDTNSKIGFSYKHIKPEKFVCKTSDAEVATCYVENNHVVIVPKKPGSVTVTLETETNGKKYEATTEITIEDSKRYISLSNTRGTINLVYSNTKVVSYTLVGIKGVVKVESLDSKVATAVLKNGKIIITGLKPGKSTITLSVTDNDKTYKADYVVTVISQVLDDNNKLNNLTTNKGVLTPSFKEDIKDYKIEVEESVNKITLIATPKSNKATIKYIYNGKSYSKFEDMKIKTGNNSVIVKVTAEDGSTNIYNVNIIKKGSSSEVEKDHNNNLSNILTSVGTLKPNFSSDRKDYTINVNSNVEKIKITGIPESSKATVSYIFGKDEFTNPKDISLKPGNNIVHVVVTAEDGTISTYTVTVIKAKDNDSTLSSLTVKPGILTPSFNPNKTHYDVILNESVNKITIDATANNKNAKVTYIYNNEKYNKFEDIPVSNGNNIVYVEVEAEDGTTTTYTVEVHKYYLDSEKSFDIDYDNKDKTREIILYTNIFNGKVDAKYDAVNKELSICEVNNKSNCVTLKTDSNLIDKIEYTGELDNPTSLAIKIHVNDVGTAKVHVKGTVSNNTIDEYDITLEIRQRYVVTFDANGGMFNELTTKVVYRIGADDVIKLSELDVPYYVLEDNDCLYYEFSHYSKSPTSDEEYPLGSEIKYSDLDGDLTLYAVYDKKDGHEKEFTVDSKLLWVADIPLFKDEKYFKEHGIDKIIFPGATGKYTLNLKNEGTSKIEFTGITLKEDTICFDDGCINMGYKIKDDNNYYFGSSNTYDILNQVALTKDWTNHHNETKKDFASKLILNPGEEVALTIHFEWVEVNDQLDTKIGNHVAKKTSDKTINDLYTLYMGLHFDVIREDCGKVNP